MSADEGTSTGDSTGTGISDEHPEVMRGGQRVIVVNSQPRPIEGDLPPRRVRGLGTVQHHASEPSVGNVHEPRSRRSGTGRALLAMLIGVPVLLAAFGIRLLAEQMDAGRLVVLGTTALLVVMWLAGLLAAWQGLGPNGGPGRGGVHFGRAVGLVIGAVGAVYLLIEVVPPLV